MLQEQAARTSIILIVRNEVITEKMAVTNTIWKEWKITC
jgi:hypothetical protein